MLNLNPAIWEAIAGTGSRRDSRLHGIESPGAFLHAAYLTKYQL
jgi:hypothetical protein